MKVAIVHDWLYGGGAERVIEELHTLYPDAPIYTSYCSDEWRKKLGGAVITGYLQHWPFAQLRRFLPLLRQWWFRSLDLSQYDIVISSSGNGEAKFVRVKDSATHICYCNTPPHFYWAKYKEYLKNPSFRPKWLARLGLVLLVKPLRKRDYQAAQKVNYFIANSSHIQKNIKAFYGRDSVVIHPPVAIEKFEKPKGKSKQQRHGFIVWGRHVPYKRFDLAIQACNRMGLPLQIIGSGPDTPRLKKLAGPSIEFLGWVSSEELLARAHASKAFLFPGAEDFGLSPVEAMAAGMPVIAYKAEGALDYVQEGITGLFFDKQNVESLCSAIKKLQTKTFSETTLQNSAKAFSSEHFRSAMSAFVQAHTKDKA